jgi:hypothetical protein
MCLRKPPPLISHPPPLQSHASQNPPHLSTHNYIPLPQLPQIDVLELDKATGWEGCVFVPFYTISVNQMKDS